MTKSHSDILKLQPKQCVLSKGFETKELAITNKQRKVLLNINRVLIFILTLTGLLKYNRKVNDLQTRKCGIAYALRIVRPLSLTGRI